jgi:hypothetical protein
VRADWFAFAASRPPLYNRLLNYPSSFQQLAQAEGVDVDDDIRRSLAKRAGFQKSGVSANNRLIERHMAHNGYFWTSYDFGGNRERQSLYEFPLGPGGPHGFNHDGGETIFSLPNGFQAYFLNNSKGQPLDKGPTNIVRDPSRKDFAVTNGISCMGCHDQGMRKAKDDIRANVLAGRAFSKDVKDAVAALYPPADIMDAVIEEDRRSETMNFLRSHGLYYTSIDAPEDTSIVPSFIEATGDQVYVRFHGKNRENWFKRNITAAERFKYLYSERELHSLAKGFGNLQEQGVKRAYTIFNNCYQNFGIMNATTMAAILHGPEQ